VFGRETGGKGQDAPPMCPMTRASGTWAQPLLCASTPIHITRVDSRSAANTRPRPVTHKATAAKPSGAGSAACSIEERLRSACFLRHTTAWVHVRTWPSEGAVTSLSWPKPALMKPFTKELARFWRAESTAAPVGCLPSACSCARV